MAGSSSPVATSARASRARGSIGERPRRQRLRQRRSFYVAVVLLLIVATVLSAVVSVAFGSVTVPLSDVVAVMQHHVGWGSAPVPQASVDSIVWQLRTPRGLLALLVGAGLALAGVAMQTLVRNPLADPYLLGVSSGASVGATAVITFGVLSSLGIWALSGGALIGAIAATATVYVITLVQGGITPLRLILTGVVLASAFSAMASFLVFIGPDPRAAQSVMFWMLGSVAGAQWIKLILPLVAVCGAALVLWVLGPRLDALATGEDVAASVGVNVARLRSGLFALQAVLVGVLVAVSGGIGFVGLVVPHVARMLVGPSHRRLVPCAMLGGAVFLLWVDVVSRVAAGGQEIPLGVVTGLIGAPLFLVLMSSTPAYSFGKQG